MPVSRVVIANDANVYDPRKIIGPGKKGIAEVIIAKHRAGSTGTVELVWLGEYTKLRDIKKLNDVTSLNII